MASKEEKGVAMIERVLSRWVVLVCLVLSVAAGDSIPAYSQAEVEITGTVFAIDNDGTGNVIAVSLLDRGGNEFVVVHDRIGDQLLKMVDKNMKVTGVINVGKDGTRYIKVQKFEIVPG